MFPTTAEENKSKTTSIKPVCIQTWTEHDPKVRDWGACNKRRIEHNGQRKRLSVPTENMK